MTTTTNKYNEQGIVCFIRWSSSLVVAISRRRHSLSLFVAKFICGQKVDCCIAHCSCCLLSSLVIVVVRLIRRLLSSIVLWCPWTFVEDHDSSSTPLSSADDNPTHCKLSSLCFLFHPLIILVEMTPPPTKATNNAGFPPLAFVALRSSPPIVLVVVSPPLTLLL